MERINYKMDINECAINDAQHIPLTINIKYSSDDLIRVKKIEIGDWIDLRAAEDVQLVAGCFYKISLGVAMALPKGYEAIVAPRSSTFDKWGIIMVNSIGIIDNSYCGNNDIWSFPALAFKTCAIYQNDRICQFRIQKQMETILFNEVDDLGNANRGGFGTTGTR